MENQEVLQPNEPALDVMAQFDQYLAQQPTSKQAFHKWMTYLMAASAGFVVAIFVKALLVSICWTQVNPLEIPFWWMAFAASVLPFAICLGLDRDCRGFCLFHIDLQSECD
jgi:ABC-type multidrug transport system permease subunit